MARAQVRLTKNLFEERFSSDDLPNDSQASLRPTRAFLRQREASADEQWQRHTFNWSAAVAAIAFVAPVVIGATVGHPIAGVGVGVLALLVVGVFAFGFWVLDNTLPF